MVLTQLGKVLQRGRRWLTAGTVALDVSDDGFTLLRLAGDRQGRQIVDFAAAPLPGDLIRNGVPQQPEAVGSFLRDLMEEEKILARDVAMALPLPCCEARVLMLPRAIPATGLRDAVRTALNGDERLPLPLSKSVMGILPLAPQATRQPVLMVLCLRQNLERWIHTVAAAGLELRQVGCTSVSLLQLLERHREHQAEHSGAENLVAVLDMQPQETQVILILGGVPEYMGTLPAVPDPKLRELMQQAQDDEDEIDIDGDEDFAALVDLKPLNLQSSRDVVWELIQVAEFLRQKRQGAVMSQVFLTGPGSIYPDIAEQIGSQCGWPTALLDPCGMLQISPPLPRGFPVGAALSSLLATAAAGAS